jgi:iron(III) transport system ATP-binding protein
MSSAIEVQHISRQFKSTIALDDVSLACGAGEILSLIGQSGCGKSTLLRIIAGLDHEHDGRVLLFGNEVSGTSVFVEPEQRSVGFMFQDYALFPHLTVEQNIGFGLRGLPAADVRAKTSALAERLAVSAMLDKYPHMLSGGEQQRVALARALAPAPRVLLMDEPFSNLDRRLAERVRAETVTVLRDLGMTAVLVTHDPEEALSFSDRIALLKAGRLIQAGTPHDLYFHPNSPYCADYFCAYNKIKAVYRGGMLETAIGAFPASFSAREGEAATVYIRPQSVHVSQDGDGLPATIKHRTFMGDAQRLQLQLDGSGVGLVAQITHQLPHDLTRCNVAVPSIGMLGFLDT